MTTDTFEYDPDAYGSREYQRLRFMPDADAAASNVDWVVHDALYHYDVDPEALLEVMEEYTDEVRRVVREMGVDAR